MLVPRPDGVLEWQPGPPAVRLNAHETVQEGVLENGTPYRMIFHWGRLVLPDTWEHHAALIAEGAEPAFTAPPPA